MLYGFSFYNSGEKIISKIDFNKTSIENNKKFELVDEKMKTQDEFYRELIKVAVNSNSTPYIPDGFEYLEGTVEEGYVIQDKDGNQYVWIPCSSSTLKKKNFSKNANISYNFCFDENYKDFLKSALENGGFYVSRYEIGNDENVPVSKKDQKVWTDITINEALEITKKMNDKVSANIELINGYAYDTTLSWLMESDSFKINSVEIDNEISTGRSSIKNIYDFVDNVFELTQEYVYDVVVARGYVGNKEIQLYSRYTLLVDDRNFDEKLSKLSFRTVMYK